MDDYTKALGLGRKQVKEALLRGEDPYPTALDEVLPEVANASKTSLGVMELPLELVAGTSVLGRKNLFSSGFMPLADAGSEFSVKWSALLEHQKEEGISDPIIVYEYLQRFYVQEGNKRVSVARYLDMRAIDAQVTRVMPSPSIGEEYQRYQEFLRFYDVAPVFGLEFSAPGSYEKLAKLLGKSLEEAWSEDDVRHLRALITTFSEAFSKVAGENPRMGMADALLIYLRFYPAPASLSYSSKEMVERLKQLQGTLLPEHDPTVLAQAGQGVVKAGKGVVHAGKGVVHAGKGVVKAGKGAVHAGHDVVSKAGKGAVRVGRDAVVKVRDAARQVRKSDDERGQS